jgi:HAD superfamily hydrolase (TIGR01509 family)
MRPPGPVPDGVVLDCDGTLADTEPLAARAWSEVLARRGVEVAPSDHAAIIGRAWPAGFDHFSARADLGDQDRFRAELRAHAADIFAAELELFPDAVATVEVLAARGVPVAVASSSSRAHVLRCLDRGGLRHHVRAVVGADDVVSHKPHPEPYLRAAAALGVAPGRVTAVEDTPVGVAGASAAGCFTVAVLRGVVDPSGLTAADRTVEHLAVERLLPPPGWVSPAA